MSFDGWKEFVFSEFVEINPTIRLDSKKEYSFVEMKDLENGKKIVTPSTKRKLTGGARFENHDTLFARITPCLENGKICQVENLEKGVGFGSTEFLIFRGKKNISDTDFVFYLARWDEVRKFAEQNLIGTSGRQRVGKEAFQNLLLNLPPLPLQKSIASILSSLDDKIELNQQTNQTLEAIAQAIFKDWFVDFNFPGATGEIQDSELGEIPKGWRVVSFEDELNADRGLSYKGAGLASSNAMPMHNLNSVYEGGGYKFKGLKYYTGDYKDKHIVFPGDLIIANTEQGHKYLLIGYPAIIPSYYGEKGIFSHHIYRLKAKPDSYMTSEYLYHLLLQPEIREQVVGFANGTTVNMLKVEGLQKPKFVLPPKDLVVKYSKLASNFRIMQEENIKQNEILTQLRDSLLPKLMKGEIEVRAKNLSPLPPQPKTHSLA
jgi:type I restriction enzyme, S subunit